MSIVKALYSVDKFCKSKVLLGGVVLGKIVIKAIVKVRWGSVLCGEVLL